ncbi:hypothetical protein GHT41_07835 [Citrobacter koseri]|uniref:hypothetical protein n=1 Tax=Citrobacter koseri TaxID=545 RepID=UPI00190355F0|nr:hypothetical protein [Citrobacter koseri]MBJ9353571.1 hypothetical protein [Citrobacter koseri]
MKSVIVRCSQGGQPIYNVIQKAADKVRSQNPDVVGRPTYTNVNEKVVFCFNSLDGKTDLNDLAKTLEEELSSDCYIDENSIPVIRDDETPLIYGKGVIVISLVK